MAAGGTDIGATVNSGGRLNVSSGGTTLGATINSGGTENVAFSGGPALAEARLFQQAMWLFTPLAGSNAAELEAEWRTWVGRFGARTMDIAPVRHDEICAWVSHLPQMVATGHTSARWGPITAPSTSPRPWI